MKKQRLSAYPFNSSYTVFKHLKKDILADSKAAIQAISSNGQPKSKMINDIKQALKHLQALKKIVISQWVPSHVGL